MIPSTMTVIATIAVGRITVLGKNPQTETRTYYFALSTFMSCGEWICSRLHTEQILLEHGKPQFKHGLASREVSILRFFAMFIVDLNMLYLMPGWSSSKRFRTTLMSDLMLSDMCGHDTVRNGISLRKA